MKRSSLCQVSNHPIWWDPHCDEANQFVYIYIIHMYKSAFMGIKIVLCQGGRLMGIHVRPPKHPKPLQVFSIYSNNIYIRFLNHGPCYDMWGYHVIWCDTVCQHPIKAHDYTPEILIETRTLPNLSPEKDLPDPTNWSGSILNAYGVISWISLVSTNYLNFKIRQTFQKLSA